jgi:hypothetical protein
MNVKQPLSAAILALPLMLAFGTAALAAADDYEFQLVEKRIKQQDDIVAVRLVDKRTGHPVGDAIVFATRMDMAPDGMEAMTSPVEILEAAEPGIHRFRTQFAMEGNWRFSVAAKIQGEHDTVVSRLVLEVMP